METLYYIFFILCVISFWVTFIILLYGYKKNKHKLILIILIVASIVLFFIWGLLRFLIYGI